MALFRPIVLFRVVLVFFIVSGSRLEAQPGSTLLKWSKDGNAYYEAKSGGIVRVDIPSDKETVIIDRELLRPAGSTAPLSIRSFAFSDDGQKVLIYTNARRVWRYDTRGDYWVLDLSSRQLSQVGKGRPVASLQFAKFSPDGTKVAYVSEHNIYVEDLSGGNARCLTSTNGTRKLDRRTHV